VSLFRFRVCNLKQDNVQVRNCQMRCVACKCFWDCNPYHPHPLAAVKDRSWRSSSGWWSSWQEEGNDERGHRGGWNWSEGSGWSWREGWQSSQEHMRTLPFTKLCNDMHEDRGGERDSQ
jgi:hypothetical protein